MAFDVGIADLVGSLFFGGDALAAGGAADAAAAAGIGADLGAGATAADLAGAAGAAGLGAAGGAAADLGASGAAAADLTGAGLGATTGAADTAAGVTDALAGAVDTVPEAVDTAGAANLGSNFGLAPGASTFTPTSVDAGSAVAQGAQALNTPPIAGGVASPTDTLAAGDANISADLGATTPPPTAGGPTTAQVAAANSPASEIVASSQVPALGGQAGAENVGQDVLSGTDFGTQSAIANAGQPSGFNFNDVTKGVGGVLNSPWTKAAELALPVGFLASNLIKGPPPLPSQATNAVNNASQNVPLLNSTAANDLALANANQISPSQAASIDVFTQNATNQMIQQLANEGITDPKGDSRYWQGLESIKQQAETMKVQYINQLISTAFQAQGAVNQADSTIMQAAQIQVQQDNQFQQSIIGATQAIALMAAFSGRGGASATT